MGPRRRACIVVAIQLAAAVVAACAGGRQAPPGESAPPDSQPPRYPLATLATQPIALLPAQYVRGGDSTGWAEQIGPQREFLGAIDREIAAQLAARGTARAWTLPDALARMARRNPAVTPDPYALSAEGFRAGVRRSNANLGEPLASQIRSLIALTDARYAIIPVEVRFEPVAGGGRAMLRIVVVDGRLSQLQRSLDVSAESPAPSAAGLAAGLAEQFVDLLVAR